MPIRKVQVGYKWGDSGKVYPTRKQAEKQAAAAYASGYKKMNKGGLVMQKDKGSNKLTKFETCAGCQSRGNCLAAGKCLKGGK